MNVLLTNNPKLSAVETKQTVKIEVRIVDATAQELVWTARDMLVGGWELLADPLGGRLAHPNPFLSLLMRENGGDKNTVSSIKCLERLLRLQWEQKDRVAAMTEEEADDLAAMDRALIHASLCRVLGDELQWQWK